MRRVLGVVAVFVGPAGCSPSIDAGSEEALERSIEEVRGSLDEDERELFDHALESIAFEAMGDFGALLDAADSEEGPGDVAEDLDGLTGDEVIEKGIRVEREAAYEEIEDLRERRTAAEEARETLDRISVERSRLDYRERPVGLDDAIIEVTVTNGLDQAISRVYFDAVVASPDRAVPWIEDEVSRSIDGGLEPGETADLEIRPSAATWTVSDVPPEAVLALHPSGADDASRQTIARADWSEWDQGHLQELESFWGGPEEGRSVDELRRRLSEDAQTAPGDEDIQVTAEARDRHQEAAHQLVEELREEREAAAEAEEARNAFQVTHSAIRYEETVLGREPVLVVHVSNQTGHPVSRVFFEGTAHSPDRATPWMEGGFNYEISGGLEPGESAEWHLSPGTLSDWSDLDAPADAVLDVEVDRLEGPGGERLFDAEWTEGDEERLADLVEAWGEPGG